MKISLIFSLVIVCVFSAFSDQKKITSHSFKTIIKQKIDILPLKIGDKVPDVYLGEVLNDPNLKTATISTFRGKLLILDFWHIWCSVCINQFPHVKSINETFKGEVIILPVGFDNIRDGITKEFINKSKGTSREINLVTAIQTTKDTLLRKLFPPVMGYPYNVWIDKNGYVVALTNHYAVTESNIRKVISEIKLPFKDPVLKKEFEFDANFSGKSLHNIKQGFVITGINDSLFHHEEMKKINERITGVALINKTPFQLYNYIYRRRLPDVDRRLVLNTKSCFPFINRLDFNEFDNWELEKFYDENLFCFEGYFNSDLKGEEIENKIIAYLDDFFGVSSCIKPVKTNCLVLVDQSDIRPHGFFTVDEKVTLADFFTTVSFSELVSYIEDLTNGSRVVLSKSEKSKQTGQIKIPKTAKSIEEIKHFLRSYGFNIVEEIRVVPMLVLECNTGKKKK